MLQRTKEEQERYLYWHRQRSQRMTPRRLLRESDELMYWLEECVERGMKIVPGWLLPRLVAIISRADAAITAEMGRERRPLEMMEFLFRAQEALMEDSILSRRPARVIPLFRPGRSVKDLTAQPEGITATPLA